MDSEFVIKKYDMSFKKFLARIVDKSKMASTIYEVRKNEKRGISYMPSKHSRAKPNFVQAF